MSRQESVLKDFNLLVTTSRGNEEDVCSEIWYLLGEVGDQAAAIDKTGVTGLVVVKTLLDPFEAIEKLRRMLIERPWEFRYTLRIIPIEKVTRTDLGEIQIVATELASKITKDETFRVTVEKRFSRIPTGELIEAAAANIERKVSLEKPDRIVLLEVIGKLTGVSVIRPTDIMSVAKEKLSPE
jgi:tRNA acetyltransferase TAN1